MRLLIFLMLFAFASLANAAGMMDTLVTQVQSASSGWMGSALGYAKNLFFGLAAIEFAWSAIQLTLKKSELSEIVVGTLFKVMSLSFFAMILIKAPEWIPAIIDSFKAAGAGVGGATVLSPSAVFDQGLGVASSLMQFSNDSAPSAGGMIINSITGSGQGLGKFMLSSIIMGVASVFIVIGYGLIAVQLLITLVESYLIIGGGALMLGFSGSRWTHNLSEKYFGYAISVGAKLFTIYLIIGFGDSFTQALKDTIANSYAAHPNEGPSFGDYLGVGGASLFYGVTGYMAPGLAGSMLNGTVSMSLQNTGAAAGMVGGAPVAAGLTAGAAGARALGMAAGAVGALMPIQKAAGAISGTATGGSFGGGISGALGSPNAGSPGSVSANGGFGDKANNSGASSKGGAGNTNFASPGRGAGNDGFAGNGLSAEAGNAETKVGESSRGAGAGDVGFGNSNSNDSFGDKAINSGASSKGGAGNTDFASSGRGADGFSEARPGFADPRGGHGNGSQRNETGGQSANAFETRNAQQRFDADYNPAQKTTMASKLNDFSKRLQHAADRRKPHLVNDGSVGHAPNLRIGLDA